MTVNACAPDEVESRLWPPSSVADRATSVAGLLRSQGSTTIAVGFVLFVVALGITAPLLGLRDPNATDLSNTLARPLTDAHLLGTDQLGRDVFSRLVWGSRYAVLEGLLPVLVATVLGALLGGIAGFVGGFGETVAMRGTDVLLAIPPVMMGIAVGATLGPGLRNVVIAMTIVLVPPVTRVARGATLAVRTENYVTAARSLGVKERWIFLRHVLPNAAAPVIAYSFSLVGIMIVFAAGLSFIGLGVQPPTADWGRMVNEGRLVLPIAPWVATAPGLAIFLVGLSFGVVGDALDRRLKHN